MFRNVVFERRMKRKTLKKIIFEQYWEGVLNRVGLIFVVLMVLTALLAPFFANNKPYVYKHDGKTSFPILEDVYLIQ